MPNNSNGKIGYSSSTSFAPNDILYMLKDLPDACCIFKVLTDPFGTVKDMLFLFANEKYAQLVGRSSAELIGNTYFKTVTNRDEDWIKYSYQAAILRQSSIARTYNSQFDKWFEFWSVPVYQKGFCAFIIHDVTAVKRNEETRTLISNTNKLVIECAKALSSAEYGKGLKKVLKLLGQTIEADRVYVVEKKQGSAMEIHEWVNATRSSELPAKKAFEKHDILELWKKQLNGKDIIVINDSAVIADQNEEIYRDVLAGMVSRYIVAVLKEEDEVIGYLCADNYANDLQLNVDEVMGSVAIFISYEMRNRALTNEMMYLGSHDALSDLGNRYALNQTLLLLSGMSVKVGVCYTDINGLKTINDELGHEAGDRVIKETAAIFAAAFKQKHCYRIGGDEFIAIVPEVTESKFKAMIKKFREKKKEVTTSLGYIWIEDSSEIDKAVKAADELMYKEKAEFYSKHERRRSMKKQ